MVWFITGCSTGFGRLLAEKLHAAGDRVVATARSLQSLYDLGREDEERMLRLPLDVRDQSTIDAAVATTLERFGRIDVLVNNAGYGYFATQEEGELEEIRQMFDTNVFGLIATTQAIVPHMRRQRSGTVVNLSSIAGKIATPRGGFYQASKWAVEALSESLYLEESSFGLRVVVIEPGSYDTDFGPRSSRVAAIDGTEASDFAELREQWRANATAKLFVDRQNPTEVVEAIIDAVASDIPFIRLPVGRDATTVIARRHELGDTAFVEWMRSTYHDDNE